MTPTFSRGFCDRITCACLCELHAARKQQSEGHAHKKTPHSAVTERGVFLRMLRVLRRDFSARFNALSQALADRRDGRLAFEDRTKWRELGRLSARRRTDL